MTRKNYFVIAYAMRNSKPLSDGDDTLSRAIYTAQVLQWNEDIISLMRQLKRDNPRFNDDMFKVACGYTLRADGSMYPMNWERGKIQAGQS